MQKTLKQKILSLLLIGGLVFSNLLMPLFETKVSAATLPDSNQWSGGVSTSFSGSGTNADPYLIQTPEDFAFLATIFNEGAPGAVSDSVYSSYIGKTFQLNHNLLFNNTMPDWLVLGTDARPFSAILDGNGGYIKSLKNASNFTAGYVNEAVSLFGTVDNATIKNLVFDSSVDLINYDSDNASLINKVVNNVTVENVINQGNITIVARANGTASHVSGQAGIISNVVGTNNTFTSIQNYGNLNSSGDQSQQSYSYGAKGGTVGGIIAHASEDVTLTDVVNNGDLTANGCIFGGSSSSQNATIEGEGGIAGGIVGFSEKSVTINQGTNTGVIQADAGESQRYAAKGGNAGGAVGYAAGNVTVNKFSNTGHLSADGQKRNTGIAGQGGNAGGIVGYAGGDSNISEGSVSANIQATIHPNSVISYQSESETGNPGGNAGGLIGISVGTVTINQSTVDNASIQTNGENTEAYYYTSRTAGEGGKSGGYIGNSQGNITIANSLTSSSNNIMANGGHSQVDNPYPNNPNNTIGGGAGGFSGGLI